MSAISCRNKTTQPMGVVLAAIILKINKKAHAWCSNISTKSFCLS